MSEEFKDKIRSVGVNVKGKAPQTKTVTDSGSTVTEHWDGRQDVNIKPKTIKMSTQVHKPEEK